MEKFNEYFDEVLKASPVNRSYAELFPLANISIALQALYISRTLLEIRKPFYPTSDFRIGLIGCGNVGGLLLRTLTDLSGIPPSRLMVSTRRPETLIEFQNEGISICYDNQKVNMFFLCYTKYSIIYLFPFFFIHYRLLMNVILYLLPSSRISSFIFPMSLLAVQSNLHNMIRMSII